MARELADLNKNLKLTGSDKKLSDSFEKVCYALACEKNNTIQKSEKMDFNNNPYDFGLEFYQNIQNGTTIETKGWQCKYLTKIDDFPDKLSESLDRAISHYEHLTKFISCINHDLNQIQRKKIIEKLEKKSNRQGVEICICDIWTKQNIETEINKNYPNIAQIYFDIRELGYDIIWQDFLNKIPHNANSTCFYEAIPSVQWWGVQKYAVQRDIFPEVCSYITNIPTNFLDTPNVILIHGKGGVGKTTFMRQLAIHFSKQRDYEVVWGNELVSDFQNYGWSAYLRSATKNTLIFLDEWDNDDHKFLKNYIKNFNDNHKLAFVIGGQQDNINGITWIKKFKIDSLSSNELNLLKSTIIENLSGSDKEQWRQILQQEFTDSNIYKVLFIWNDTESREVLSKGKIDIDKEFNCLVSKNISSFNKEIKKAIISLAFFHKRYKISFEISSFDRLSKFLGNNTEVNAESIINQIPKILYRVEREKVVQDKTSEQYQMQFTMDDLAEAIVAESNEIVPNWTFKEDESKIFENVLENSKSVVASRVLKAAISDQVFGNNLHIYKKYIEQLLGVKNGHHAFLAPFFLPKTNEKAKSNSFLQGIKIPEKQSYFDKFLKYEWKNGYFNGNYCGWLERTYNDKNGATKKAIGKQKIEVLIKNKDSKHSNVDVLRTYLKFLDSPNKEKEAKKILNDNEIEKNESVWDILATCLDILNKSKQIDDRIDAKKRAEQYLSKALGTKKYSIDLITTCLKMVNCKPVALQFTDEYEGMNKKIMHHCIEILSKSSDSNHQKKAITYAKDFLNHIDKEAPQLYIICLDVLIALGERDFALEKANHISNHYAIYKDNNLQIKCVKLLANDIRYKTNAMKVMKTLYTSKPNSTDIKTAFLRTYFYFGDSSQKSEAIELAKEIINKWNTNLDRWDSMFTALECVSTDYEGLETYIKGILQHIKSQKNQYFNLLTIPFYDIEEWKNAYLGILNENIVDIKKIPNKVLLVRMLLIGYRSSDDELKKVVKDMYSKILENWRIEVDYQNSVYRENCQSGYDWHIIHALYHPELSELAEEKAKEMKSAGAAVTGQLLQDEIDKFLRLKTEETCYNKGISPLENPSDQIS